MTFFLRVFINKINTSCLKIAKLEHVKVGGVFYSASASFSVFYSLAVLFLYLASYKYDNVSGLSWSGEDCCDDTVAVTGPAWALAHVHRHAIHQSWTHATHMNTHTQHSGVAYGDVFASFCRRKSSQVSHDSSCWRRCWRKPVKVCNNIMQLVLSVSCCSLSRSSVCLLISQRHSSAPLYKIHTDPWRCSSSASAHAFDLHLRAATLVQPLPARTLSQQCVYSS